MEPSVGFEPTTFSLRKKCSTPELRRLDKLIVPTLTAPVNFHGWRGLVMVEI